MCHASISWFLSATSTKKEPRLLVKRADARLGQGARNVLLHRSQEVLDDGNMSKEHRSQPEGACTGHTWDKWGIKMRNDKSELYHTDQAIIMN